MYVPFHMDFLVLEDVPYHLIYTFSNKKIYHFISGVFFWQANVDYKYQEFCSPKLQIYRPILIWTNVLGGVLVCTNCKIWSSIFKPLIYEYSNQWLGLKTEKLLLTYCMKVFKKKKLFYLIIIFCLKTFVVGWK
jgi:hypothetical protein